MNNPQPPWHEVNNLIPVGYEALKEQFSLESMPHFRKSFVLLKGASHTSLEDHIEVYYYTKHYLPKNLLDPFAHIEFALKHEGVNLELFLALFQVIDKNALCVYIKSQPTSKIARKVWFLYEWLINEKLPLPDATGGSYTFLLDAKEYYTIKPVRSRRHYVYNNLLGNRYFCPLVRRTSKLKKWEEKKLSQIANRLMNRYDQKVIVRAVNYLYVKETMSSYQIEHEKPDASRAQKFITLLKRADTLGPLSKKILLELQNSIVDPRFADKDYRHFQNFIGTQIRLDMLSQIDYIAPKPGDVISLMQGLLESLETMCQAKVHPVVIAASIAFGFVFIHPFEDGNGRLHRFLIHYLFARQKFVPPHAIFPVSSVMLNNIKEYNAILERFSKPLMQRIDYGSNKEGELDVKGSTDLFYRYIDYTSFAEYLFDCVDKTIQTDFKNELNYLAHFDKAKLLLQEIVDMPDKKLVMFMQCVIQNHGTLSKRKKEDHFSLLTEDEVSRMEAIVKKYLCA